MDTPQNHIWGPHLWLILHSSAEKIDSKQLKLLPEEEKRLWLGLMNSLRFSLPCPLCKNHYNKYFLKHPITEFNKNFMRIWLFNLHNDINIRKQQSISLTIENIPEIYNKPFNFTHHFKIVEQEMKKAIRIGWCSHEDIYRSIRFFQELKRYYDFF